MNRNVSPSIFSVGIDNPDATLFEQQYILHHGMSYNSYLLIDNSIAIIDSVEKENCGRWIAHIEARLDGRTPDYLVVQHMEPDHSASIALAMNRWPGLRIVASPKAIGMLDQFFPGLDLSARATAVAEGETLPLGPSHSLSFFNAPMVHWPEVIVSFDTISQTLFSADAFGKFGALQHPDNWIDEARRYYINIVGKYGPQVQALLKKIRPLPITTIAPLHGPLLTGSDITAAMNAYEAWSTYTPETKGILIAYGSIYGGTRKAALDLADTLRRDPRTGEVVTMDLSLCDHAEAVAQAFRLPVMIVASPTYDASIFPPVYNFLHHLTLKNYRNRTVGFIENGSWAPTAARQIRTLLESLPGITFIDPVVKIKSRLNAESALQLQALADVLLNL